jgi:hypothetical protein
LYWSSSPKNPIPYPIPNDIIKIIGIKISQRYFLEVEVDVDLFSLESAGVVKSFTFSFATCLLFCEPTFLLRLNFLPF